MSGAGEHTGTSLDDKTQAQQARQISKSGKHNNEGKSDHD
jgi:hypothetical protein